MPLAAREHEVGAGEYPLRVAGERVGVDLPGIGYERDDTFRPVAARAGGNDASPRQSSQVRVIGIGGPGGCTKQSPATCVTVFARGLAGLNSLRIADFLNF